MKNKRTLLLSIFLLGAALTLAQTPPTANAAANGQAQPLRRYQPQMRNVEKKLVDDTLYVSIEKSIPPATEEALTSYFTGRYKLASNGIDIYRVPGAANLYFVLGTVLKDQQPETIEGVNVFLVLREEGKTVSEVSKVENENDSLVRAPVFFAGQNRLLALVTLSAGDGSLAGHYAYEYADNNLKPLGDIGVIEKLGMSGSVWITNNSMSGATAEYKNNTYYVTMRGRGTLYTPGGMDKYKKIASPKSPVTFIYDKGAWRQLAARQAGRG